MRKGQKAGLAGVFCLGLVIVVFDILRTVESLASGTFSGVALWSSMKVSIAVIVASLPPYHTLLGKKRERARFATSAGTDISNSTRVIAKKLARASTALETT